MLEEAKIEEKGEISGGRKRSRKHQASETACGAQRGWKALAGSAETVRRALGIKHQGTGGRRLEEELVLHPEDPGEAFQPVWQLPWKQKPMLLWLALEWGWTEWGHPAAQYASLCSPRSSFTPVQRGTQSPENAGHTEVRRGKPVCLCSLAQQAPV